MKNVNLILVMSIFVCLSSVANADTSSFQKNLESRVNVIPKNDYVKTTPEETTKNAVSQEAKTKGEKVDDKKTKLEKTK